MFENFGSYGFNPLFNNNQQPQQQPQNAFNFNQMQQTPKATGNYFYINGVEGAKSFFVSQPNMTVILFDSDSQDFFVKSTNAQGQATLRRFSYKEKSVNEPKETIQQQDFVSRKEFEDFKAQFNKPQQVQQHKTEVKAPEVKGENKQ